MIKDMQYSDLANLSTALSTAVAAGLMSREQATSVWKHTIREASHLVQLPPYGAPPAEDKKPKVAKVKKD